MTGKPKPAIKPRRTPYPIPGLSKAQRHVFEQLATGNYTLAGVMAHPRTIAKLLDRGIIVRDGDEVVGRDHFGAIRVPSYHVPLGLHFAWCEWCGEQPDEEDEGG